MKQFWGKKELILLEISPKAILVLQPKSNLLLFSPSVLNLKLSDDNSDTKIYLKEERFALAYRTKLCKCRWRAASLERTDLI